MFTEIVEKKKLTEFIAAHYFKQLLNGLQYCHDNNICHRDIKPENLLISQDREIKITDFGLSNIFGNDFLRTACGSPCYAPP
jgi:serine/threonine-protein kinase HSL1 (negative regulator of Swe1 kinase)